MFSNSVYNFPPQYNENVLTQNLAGLSLNSAQTRQDSQQQQQRQNADFGTFQFPQQQRQNTDFGTFQFPQPQQHMPVDIGGYVPPTLDEGNLKWLAPDDTSVSYQRGSTVVRQYNNSMIDDYYKKYTRPITDYVPIPTNGQPTYVYQNLDGQQVATGTVPTQQSFNPGEVPNDASFTAPANAPQSNTDGTEEKKHKKKHKKRSSKHSHGESSKHGDSERVHDERKSGTTHSVDYQQQSTGASTGNVYHQQQMMSAAPEKQTSEASSQVAMRDDSNPVAFFDIEIDGDARGRLVMELFRHVVPRTAQNFLSLCLNEHGFGYRLSYFHRIIPGFMAQGGDFEKSNGTGGYSIYGEKFDDEGFPYLHDRSGLLSMANSGPNTNGSQFFLTFVPCPHLDKKHVVFGQVLQGFHILKDLEMSGSDNGDVSREVKIANCGQLQ
ncbi:unnamed protein product [Rotaria sp. Silwood2]|nr:unnamed protein product [Rotaria sp. Silwood2]CAF2528915.1 unnamed protein product [Rotaria sp. Silwood2]CAF2939747.1 unnamed protein product [Rotaria sp. Silwood2]CAF3903188.1 unnamed protein product [Rotaria sp. Silwood2]CAF4017860.1 unnamed protein product [Rotaria sp. Silwood2]